ncbi:MAG TPA: cupin domain-containing protein [Aurantimonas sp.]|jgi:mannose-6-phosphate isomerase-like protein (cupin superfamily)|nr:cupin domain-containing protein [Aurantimonas sp.]
MLTRDHTDGEREKWREGVMTQMRISALAGSHQICIFEQWCEPGLGAPTHHHAVEEVLEVMAGRAEIWVEAERQSVEPNQSVLIPAGARHGFRNIGEDILRVRATVASPIFEGSYDDAREQSRRWVPTF